MHKKYFVLASLILFTIVGVSFAFAKLPPRSLKAAAYDILAPENLVEPRIVNGIFGVRRSVVEPIASPVAPMPVVEYSTEPSLLNEITIDSKNERVLSSGENPVRIENPELRIGKDSIRINDNRNSIESNGGFLSFIVGSGSWPSNSNIQSLWERVRILANGFVGINVVNPQGVLHINNPSSDDRWNIKLTTKNTGTGVSDGANIGNGGSFGNEFVFQNQEVGPISFWTNQGDGILRPSLFMKENGNVGIGTKNPSQRLHVLDGDILIMDDTINDVEKDAQLRLGTNLDGETGRGLLGWSTAGKNLYLMTYGNNYPVHVSGDYINFFTKDATGNLISQLEIDRDGPQVAIPTKLVVGRGGFSGQTSDLYVKGITETGGICLPNGTISGKIKCFKSVCPATNGQWTLSETATCDNVAETSNPKLTITTYVNSSPAKYLVMGSVNNSLTSVKFSADNVEDILLTTVAFQDVISNNVGTKPSLTTFMLYDGNTIVGGPVNMAGDGSGVISFGLSTPVTVLRNGSKVLTLKSDVATFTSGSSVSNSGHTLNITDGVKARGKDSGLSLSLIPGAITSSHSGNKQTVYRTKPTIVASTLGTVNGRVRIGIDDIATIAISANNAGDLSLSKIQLKFQGMAISNGRTVTARLIDSNTGTDWSGLSAQSCAGGQGNSCSVSFNFTTIPTITRGATKNLKLRVNSTMFNNQPNAGDLLSVVINARGDFFWSDGTTNNIPLETFITPLSVAAISYE